MSQVGNIKGYHDGTTYSLADIYNEKFTLLEKSALVDTDDVTTKQVIWFDSDAGMTSVGNFTPQLYQNKKVSWYYQLELVDDISSCITKSHTAFDWGLNINSSRVLKDMASWSKTNFPLESKRYFPVITLEAWNYLVLPNTALVNKAFMSWCGMEQPHGSTYSQYNNHVHTLFIYCDSNTTTAGIYPRTWNYTNSSAYNDTSNTAYNAFRNNTNYTHLFELDRSFFTEPFHFAYIKGYNQKERLYINGNLYWCANYVDYSSYIDYSCADFTFNGCLIYDTTNGWTCRNPCYQGSILSEFRFSIGARYDDNFVPQSFKPKIIPVDANMLIRHNSANCYIPLTTDASKTTKPYLVTRHGSTNYYAIK